jgi:hypothetical protein
VNGQNTLSPNSPQAILVVAGAITGAVVGFLVGVFMNFVGLFAGTFVGIFVGFFDGTLVVLFGALVGAFVGSCVGAFVGNLVGDFVGTLVTLVAFTDGFQRKCMKNWDIHFKRFENKTWQTITGIGRYVQWHYNIHEPKLFPSDHLHHHQKSLNF